VIEVERLDHLVLTVADVEATCCFYARVLGFEPITFNNGRRALRFGDMKINLHALSAPAAPLPVRPTPGSGDLCFTTRTPLAEVAAHLAAEGVEVVEGPVERTGARAPLRSLYFLDPDGNALEISNEL